MVGKGAVLLWIEHFQQRRGRVPAEIGTDLVDFVEQDNRIFAFGAAQALNDPAGHGADIGPPVTPNFSFVPESSEGHADELSAERIGQAFSQGSFPDAGRPNQTQNGPLEILL